MTSEDVTMFRKQLILCILREIFYFCAVCLFVSRIFSLSLGENNFSEGCICVLSLSVFFVVFFGGEHKT